MFKETPLPHKIHMLAHIIEQHASTVLHEKFDLAFNSYVILHVLTKHKILNQHFLAQKLQLTTAAISKRIKLLSEKGLVMANTNKDNRREQHINITPKGKKIHDKATIVLENNFNEMIKKYPHSKELDKQLNLLLTNICSEHHDRKTC